MTTKSAPPKKTLIRKSLAETMESLHEEKERDLEALTELVRAAAAEESIDPRELRRVLKATDHTPDMFEVLVSTLQERIALRKEHGQLSTKQQELARELAKLDEINQALEAAVTKHRAAAIPLQHRIHELKRECARIEQIPSELLMGSPLPGGMARLQQLNRRGERFCREAADLDYNLAGAKGAGNTYVQKVTQERIDLLARARAENDAARVALEKQLINF